MNSSGNLIRVTAIILFLAAPAVTIRIFSNYYGAQHLQPLALTKESVAAVDQGLPSGNFTRIDVKIGWGRDWAGELTQARLRQVIAATLETQTEFYHFEFDDQPGAQIDVTFVVGPNSYGPFPPGRMTAGIKSALMALKLTRGQKG